MVIDRIKKVNKQEKSIKNEKASDMMIGKWVKCDNCKEILYKDDVIGEIRFKGIEDSCSEIGIVLKNDRYKNKGMGTIALTKALDYAKDHLKINKIVAKILKTNKRSQHLFEKIGFVFYDEDEHFVNLRISKRDKIL